MSNVFYNRIIRKLVVGFGNLFNNIALVRYNPDLSEAERIIVPISYAAKELYVKRLQEDPYLNKKIQTTLPRLSFEMTGFTYDASRKQNTNVKNFAKTTGGVVSQYNPVPYNFDFELYLYVRNIEDGTQIIEHILSYFTPDYTIKLNLIPEMSTVKEIPIVLNSASQDIQYEGDQSSETRIIIWTLNFTVKGFIYGGVSDAGGLIRNSITNIMENITSSSEIQFVMNQNTGVGQYQVGEVVYQGYSASTATATAVVVGWNNNNLTLKNINGNFVSNIPIIGLKTNSNYKFTSYDSTENQYAKIYVTPTPTDANANSLYTVTTTVMETPNIVDDLVLPTNFAGDVMIQVGTDDLQTEQEKQTDLGS